MKSSIDARLSSLRTGLQLKQNGHEGMCERCVCCSHTNWYRTLLILDLYSLIDVGHGIRTGHMHVGLRLRSLSV